MFLGFDGSTGLNSAEMFDPNGKNEWINVSPMSTRRSSVGVGVVNGRLFAVSIIPSAFSSLHSFVSKISIFNLNSRDPCIVA
jgi:hypothetical protein